MKRTLTLLISGILVLSGCNHSKNYYLAEKDFTFEIEFYPSFMPNSRIVLQKRNGKQSLHFYKIYGKRDSLEIEDPDALFIANEDSFASSKVNNDFSGHLLHLEMLETVRISDTAINKLIEDLEPVELTTQKNFKEGGCLDGITLVFNFRMEGIDNSFGLRCPRPRDKPAFNIVTAVFELFDHSLKTKPAKNYVEHLKDYFDLGTKIYRISMTPHAYQMPNYLSKESAEEVNLLFESLPDNKPIIFYLEDTKGWDAIFNKNFETLVQQNSKVYWLVNADNCQKVLDLGVKVEMIFENEDSMRSRVDGRKM